MRDHHQNGIIEFEPNGEPQHNNNEVANAFVGQNGQQQPSMRKEKNLRITIQLIMDAYIEEYWVMVIIQDAPNGQQDIRFNHTLLTKSSMVNYFDGRKKPFQII